MPSNPLLTSPAAVRRHRAAAGLSDVQVIELIREASDRFRDRTGQTISRVVDDVETVDPDGSAVLLLRELPVVDVTKIVVDDVEIDPKGLWSETGIIRRHHQFPRHFRSVVVTYTHGYDPIPSTVAAAVAEAAVIAGTSTPGVSGGAMVAGPFQFTAPNPGATANWSAAVRTYGVRS